MKKIILIVFIVIAVAGCTIFGYFYYNSKQERNNDPSEVLTNYYEALKDKNYEKMYSYLSESSKDMIKTELIQKNSIDSEDELAEKYFISRNKNIYEGIEANNIEISISQVNELNTDKTQIKYQTTMNTGAGKISFSNTANLLKAEDKKFYLDWSSKLIYPELENTDKVRVSTIPALRGQLLDRNGVYLAKRGTASSVGLVPGKMGENKEQDIKKIAELLETTVENINDKLKAPYVKDDVFVPIKTISSSKTDVINSLLQIKGIKIQDEEQRQYPLGEKLSHLIGYVQGISAEELKANSGKGYTSNSVIGKSGLEKVYEDRLRGVTGFEIYVEDASAERKHTIVKREKKDGDDIKLTIDSNLQSQIYEDYKTEKSATVVINPKTGEILALVSTPSYDSNDFIYGMSQEKWNELSNNANTPLISRFQATWAPGSSFKPVVGAIGLTTNKFTATENFGKTGTSWQKNASWGNFRVTTHAQYSGYANLRNALIYSDNIYFAKAALKIGTQTLVDSLTKIGFNNNVPCGIDTYKSQYANSAGITSEAQLANTGYGQGEVLVNPIHMASIYSAFVNEGNMIKPYLEFKENALSSAEYWIQNAFTKEAANTIKDDLVQVVENPGGTGYGARTYGMKLAGKTGTAEIKKSTNDTTGTELGWFNAFIADETSQKQMLVISMIEDVKNRNGSLYVVPKVKKIFSY